MSMVLFHIRSVTAASLSLWLGVLACLLGCAKPTAASSRPAGTEQNAAARCPEGGGEAGDSCCQHGHDPRGTSDKSGHQAKSCCPTETALAERKNALIAPAVVVDVIALAMPVTDAAAVDFLSLDASVVSRRLAGRDILRKVHVLRI